jgi:hypothetical protein
VGSIRSRLGVAIIVIGALLALVAAGGSEPHAGLAAPVPAVHSPAAR